jgi:hypothetical protein
VPTTKTPSSESLQLAREAATRALDRKAPVRNGFIQRADPKAADPPLARLMRGGQGGGGPSQAPAVDALDRRSIPA